MNDVSKTSEWVKDCQIRLAQELVNRFNSKIDTNQKDGHVRTKEDGDYFEGEIEKIVRKYFSEVSSNISNVSIDKGYVRDSTGRSYQMDIVVKHREPSTDTDILALIEVKSFADLSGYNIFKKKLTACDSVERGFYVGIAGTMKGVSNGENQAFNPKVFFFAKATSANISKKIRMKELRNLS